MSFYGKKIKEKQGMPLETEDLNKILFFLEIKIEYLFNLHCIKLFQIVKERWFFV